MDIARREKWTDRISIEGDIRVRRELLAVVLRYYQLHVEQLGEIKSLAVLSEVLAG